MATVVPGGTLASVTLILITIALVMVLFVLAVLTARLFRDYPASELLDWKPTRSPEVEAQNEIDDVQQMLDAQNEYRRRRGAKEITEADVERQVREDQAVRAAGRGPFAEGAGVEDDVDEVVPPMRPRKRSKKSGKKR
jgi:hypothetical protein